MTERKLLFISRWFPFPPDNGSKLRIYHLLGGLAQEYKITLISFSDQPVNNHDVSQVKEICEHVLIVPWKAYQPGSLRSIIGFFRFTPRSLLDTYSDEMARVIKNEISDSNYDLVIASQLEAASYHRSFNDLPAIFEEVEIGVYHGNFANSESFLDRFRHGLTWIKLKRYLVGLLQSYEMCTVVSKEEQALLRANIKGNISVEVIPNCINLNDYLDVSEKRSDQSLIFTGPFTYRANYEAMLWFIEKAFARIKAHVPNIRLTITGDHDNLPLPEMEGVYLTGIMPDIRPLIAQATVSIAPILTGGGTRLKILEAMALRTPVVTTSKGAEGLDVKNTEHLLIANTPETFSDAILELIRDSNLREKITENAFHLVQEKYDWDIVFPTYVNIIDSVTAPV